MKPSDCSATSVLGTIRLPDEIRKGKLGIGLQVGMLTVAFDPSDINLGDETDDDAFPTTSESGTSVDLGVGHTIRILNSTLPFLPTT